MKTEMMRKVPVGSIITINGREWLKQDGNALLGMDPTVLGKIGSVPGHTQVIVVREGGVKVNSR